MKPLFICDWDRVFMIHYAVDPGALQGEVPVALDLCAGQAYVSLVAFTLRDMRFCSGGPFTAWMTAPVANHAYLNVRTYVDNAGEKGIYFMKEWLSSRLAAQLGPCTFGLPLAYGRIDYRHNHASGRLEGNVSSRDGDASLSYAATLPSTGTVLEPEPGSLTEFLMERYVAYTSAGSIPRKFRVWHEPWPQMPASAEVQNRGLLERSGDWHRHAELAGANYCRGLREVGMGRPMPACIE
jgi:hypothetical protein